MTKRLAVVGAGPKGVALACKAAAMRAAGVASAPEVVLFESKPVAASWRGGYGYTDGQHPLCTLAERDLGFPYDSASFGQAVASHMHAHFSWPAWTVAGRSPSLERWVLQDRRRPLHGEFAAYLQHACDRSQAHVVVSEVIGLDAVARGRWRLDFLRRPPSGGHQTSAGHVTEMLGHAPEFGGHDAETGGHAPPKYAVNDAGAGGRQPDGAGLDDGPGVPLLRLIPLKHGRPDAKCPTVRPI